MNLLEENTQKTVDLVLKQLNNFWDDTDAGVILAAVPATLEAMKANFKGSPNRRFYDSENDRVIFSPVYSIQWMIFLYRLSHQIYLNGEGSTPKEADQVYYLNKVMHSNDWFYAIDLPEHFMCEHPLGSVLGRASYGDHFFVYQGSTVGGNRSKGVLSYPVIGDNVILFANSTVLGDTRIGNNVVVSAGTQIINETVLDNCIVFGKSPELVIKTKSENEIKEYTKHIWGWEV